MSGPGVDLLVIGGSGQDGHYLIAAARDAGLTVRGTSRRGRDGLDEVDPRDAGALAALLDRLCPLRIVLLSGQSSVGASWREPGETVRSHVRPLLTTLEWMRTRGPDTRLVYAASGECFGPRAASWPAREDDPLSPVTPYGVAKTMAATLLRGYRSGYGLHASNAFLFNHESPRRPETFVFGKLIAGLARLRRAPDGPPIILGDTRVVRDWGWAPDYCAAMLAMSNRSAPEDLIIATGKSVSLHDAARAMARAADLDPETSISGGAGVDGHPGADQQHADPQRARDTIGWTGSIPFPALAPLLVGELR